MQEYGVPYLQFYLFPAGLDDLGPEFDSDGSIVIKFKLFL